MLTPVLLIAALTLFLTGSTWAQSLPNAYDVDKWTAPRTPAPTPTPAPTTAPTPPPNLLPTPEPDPGDKSTVWGALAFTADGSWATAWLKPSKPEAESNVAVACAKFGRGQCEVVSFNGTYCAALATYIGAHSRHRYKLSFSGGGHSVHEAQGAAMDNCNNDSRTRGHCQLRTTVCGDGR
jgi:hypothetical protein